MQLPVQRRQDRKSQWRRELLQLPHPALARKHDAGYDGWKVLVFRPGATSYYSVTMAISAQNFDQMRCVQC